MFEHSGMVRRVVRAEPPPTLELTRQGLIDLLEEADVAYPPRATKSVLLDLVVQHRQGAFIEFLEATKRATAKRTLESLARIELGAQGGALLERVTTTRTTKDGAVTTTVRERFTAPDWHADGWFLEPRAFRGAWQPLRARPAFRVRSTRLSRRNTVRSPKV